MFCSSRLSKISYSGIPHLSNRPPNNSPNYVLIRGLLGQQIREDVAFSDETLHSEVNHPFSNPKVDSTSFFQTPTSFIPLVLCPLTPSSSLLVVFPLRDRNRCSQQRSLMGEDQSERTREGEKRRGIEDLGTLAWLTSPRVPGMINGGDYCRFTSCTGPWVGFEWPSSDLPFWWGGDYISRPWSV